MGMCAGAQTSWSRAEQHVDHEGRHRRALRQARGPGLNMTDIPDRGTENNERS